MVAVFCFKPRTSSLNPEQAAARLTGEQAVQPAGGIRGVHTQGFDRCSTGGSTGHRDDTNFDVPLDGGP